MNVAIKCPFDGTLSHVEVDLDQYHAWNSGTLIQDAMPNVSDTDRETLMTGMCSRCQGRVFGEDDGQHG